MTLPWNVLTTEKIDIIKAKDVLDRDHYDLEKIKERILEYLAVLELKPAGQGADPLLCRSAGSRQDVAGTIRSPKRWDASSFACRSAACATKPRFAVIAGPTSARCPVRSSRTSAAPDRAIRFSCSMKSTSWVRIFAAIRRRRLLEVLDPEQNSTFRDHYLDVAFDLSRVFFITTANVLDTIPSALRDRMEIIELPGYTEEEKLQIARQYLVPRGRENNGLKPEQIEFEDEALSHGRASLHARDRRSQSRA